MNKLKKTSLYLTLVILLLMFFLTSSSHREWEMQERVETVQDRSDPDGSMTQAARDRNSGDNPENGRSTQEEEESEKRRGAENKNDPSVRTKAYYLDRLKEPQVYTFLQGPKAWEAKTDWSGSWCQDILGGQNFSVFGCGLCDLANIYSTLTDYDCSPVDMFHYACEASGYAPSYESGAIDWPYMRDTLRTLGIRSILCRKETSYEAFRKRIEGGITAIALVSSYNDMSYWTQTPGHYVNLWLYDQEEDTVFLADSGDPSHNRQRIGLRTVYDALMTDSSFQYLLVTEVDPDGNRWKHNGIDINWCIPDYFS